MMDENTPDNTSEEEKATEATPLPKNGNGNGDPLDHIVKSIWGTPLGTAGMMIATGAAVLMVLAIILVLTGLVDNLYFIGFSFVVLPMILMLGITMVPIAGWIARKRWLKDSSMHALVDDVSLQINLSDPKHRKYLLVFSSISMVGVIILAIASYEAFHFTESASFCGQVCHSVMDPQYTSYKRSSHGNVACVECHIGSGASWFVKAKISGLRQVVAVFTGDFNKPIPAPVTNLRPARDTCEQCHWPDRFHGKRLKTFNHFSNNNQKEPEVQEIALHIGGRNPFTDKFEGIHFHVSADVKVQYQPLTPDRTEIGAVKVTHSDGLTDLYTTGEEPGPDIEWREMDCVDCHNRPAHFFDSPEARVDFGLLNGSLNPEIEGLREDSLTVLHAEYDSREQAQEEITRHLMELQKERSGVDSIRENEQDLIIAGQYLIETYMNNIWPELGILWGTYKEHIGHQNEDDGYGCFRCHDDNHETHTGKTISQDCGLCHDEPE